LQYAHERRLVHLDLKPSNVLLAADGQPMLLDFHLAQEPIDPGRGEPIRLGGTPGYMSPEQEATLWAIQQGRKPEWPIDGRSDVYSLGVLLYEALSGRDERRGMRDEKDSSSSSLIPRPSSLVPRTPLHRSNPRVSIGLSDVVSKCLTQEPRDRYPQMASL